MHKNTVLSQQGALANATPSKELFRMLNFVLKT